MKVLMITKSIYESDARVRREAETLTGMGHSLQVIAVDEDSQNIDAIDVIGLGEVSGLRGSRATTRSWLYRPVRWFLLPEHRARAIRQFQRSVMDAAGDLETAPNIIHAHDFPALEPAVELADRFDAKLIYDTHEIWTGMQRHGRPEPIGRARTKSLETTLARKAQAVITVSEGAAKFLGERWGLPVSVVRNTFPTHADLGPPEHPSGVVYAGRVGSGRDLETAFESSILTESPGFGLHLMGPADNSVVVPSTVVSHPSGSLEEVDRLLAKVGIALVTLIDGPVNHRVALPNKLFQAVSVGVPVVAANLPEMRSLVDQHGIGVTYTPRDPDSMAEAIGRVRDDYPTYVANVRAAQSALSWDVDSSRLSDIYESIDGGPPPG